MAEAASMMGLDNGDWQQQHSEWRCSNFQMPLHYPRYSRTDYENMPEWMLNRLLKEYGIIITGGLDYKRNFAMGAFLWPTD